MALRQGPFNWISPNRQKPVFIVFIGLTFLLLSVFEFLLGRPLKTPGIAPRGIISFELAGNLSSAQKMIESWGPAGQVYASLSLGLDFLFIVAYVGTIGLGCVLVARSLSQRRPRLAQVGVFIAWLLLVAGLLDVFENLFLIQVLLGDLSQSWPKIATVCAIVKFLIVGFGIFYVVGFGILLLIYMVMKVEI